MAFDHRYYHNPFYAYETCQSEELRLKRKRDRKMYRAINGCGGCGRFRKELKVCSEGQKPHSGGFCRHWWDDRSEYRAPEIED